MEKMLSPQITIRLFREGKCFGPGLAELLSRVERTHSLRAAAASMNMAYSKAWRIVKQSENTLGFKLLNSVTGGQHGGGAVLTEEAVRILCAYRGYEYALRNAAQELFASVFLPAFKGE